MQFLRGEAVDIHAWDDKQVITGVRNWLSSLVQRTDTVDIPLLRMWGVDHVAFQARRDAVRSLQSCRLKVANLRVDNQGDAVCEVLFINGPNDNSNDNFQEVYTLHLEKNPQGQGALVQRISPQ